MLSRNSTVASVKRVLIVVAEENDWAVGVEGGEVLGEVVGRNIAPLAGAPFAIAPDEAVPRSCEVRILGRSAGRSFAIELPGLIQQLPLIFLDIVHDARADLCANQDTPRLARSQDPHASFRARAQSILTDLTSTIIGPWPSSESFCRSQDCVDTFRSPEVLKGLPGLTQRFGEVSQV
jgi:hypothetical protein